MVPPSTIARIFSEVSFSNDSTKITSSTMALSAEYIRLFVSEAVLRSNAQRLSESAPTEISGIDNVVPDEAPLDVHEQFSDDSEDFYERERSQEMPTQIPPSNDVNDTLTTRHLAAVSGLLTMDF